MPETPQPSVQDTLLTKVSLLQRAKDGENHPAWEELLKYYEPFVTKVLLAMNFRGADLEDAKQQVFVRLWRGLHTYERDPKRALFRTWFARLIRNTALNIIRSKNLNPTGPSFDDEQSNQTNLQIEETEVEKKVEEEWQQYVVQLAMDRARLVFSGNAINVFLMSLEGKSVENIAETLNIKVNTVYILKHRVKTVLLKEIKQLKRDLEDFGDLPAS